MLSYLLKKFVLRFFGWNLILICWSDLLKLIEMPSSDLIDGVESFPNCRWSIWFLIGVKGVLFNVLMRQCWCAFQYSSPYHNGWLPSKSANRNHSAAKRFGRQGAEIIWKTAVIVTAKICQPFEWLITNFEFNLTFQEFVMNSIS